MAAGGGRLYGFTQLNAPSVVVTRPTRPIWRGHDPLDDANTQQNAIPSST